MYAERFSIGRVFFALAALVIALPLGCASSLAQYRAGIGCPEQKIDALNASVSLKELECVCFGDLPEYRAQCRRESTPPPISVSSPTYRVYEGKDIDGDDLAIQRSSNLASCTAACKNQAGCKAFSYDKWNRWCFLKRSVPTELRVEPNSIVAVISTASPVLSSRPVQIEKYPDARFPDIPYREFSSSSFESCKSECSYDSVCEVFTYERRNRTCKLIRRPGEYFRQSGPNQGAYDSGVKRQRAPG
jgi:PAN domain